METTINPLALGIHLHKPPHDPVQLHPVPSKVVAEWPVGTFVENLLPRQDGNIWVTVHSTNQLLEISPTEVSPADAAKRLVAEFPAACAGIVEALGAVFINVGDIGQPGAAIYRVQDDGTTERWVDIPDGRFLNGSAVFAEDKLLVGDAILGVAFLVDLTCRTATPWIDHDLLRKVTPEPYLPGVNGMKVYGGYAYFSNTDRAIVLRSAITANGLSGPLEIIAERLTADDFAFDQAGAIYLTTHVQNSLLRLHPDGRREDLAGPEQGLAGSTSAAFGRSPDHRTDLFVTTTGGILEPYGGKVAPAKLLRLAVGAAGANITGETH